MNIFDLSRVRGLSTSSRTMPKKSSCMPTLSMFNLIRLGIYIGILICTIICLAIAVHFHSILVSSDLTSFIPFAIFVSSASLAVLLALLVSTFFKQRSPISTRVELACLGFLAVLWLALGSFLAASESAEADVECFDSDSTLEDPVEYPGFTTDIFHAQYRVLEVFSILALILAWGFLLFLLFLALRQHYKGYRKVWLCPVPVYPWFGSGSKPGPYKHSSREKTLPAPVTAMPSRHRANSRRAQMAAGKLTDVAKPKTTEYRKSAFWVWVERPPKAKAKAPPPPPQKVPAAHTRAHARDRTGERIGTRNAAHDRDRNRDHNRDIDRDREREREREKEREREREKERERERRKAEPSSSRRTYPAPRPPPRR